MAHLLEGKKKAARKRYHYTIIIIFSSSMALTLSHAFTLCQKHNLVAIKIYCLNSYNLALHTFSSLYCQAIYIVVFVSIFGSTIKRQLHCQTASFLLFKKKQLLFPNFYIMYYVFVFIVDIILHLTKIFGNECKQKFN